jgi:hypothetical protein
VTFYNIIFGLLFLGAIRQLALFVVSGNALGILACAALAVFVFNDTITTAQYVEDDSNRYSERMKLLDLLSFLVLTTGLVLLSPNDNFLFTRSSGPVDTELPHLLWFRASLATYWIIAILWNVAAESARNGTACPLSTLGWILLGTLVIGCPLARVTGEGLQSLVQAATLAVLVALMIGRYIQSGSNETSAPGRAVSRRHAHPTRR